MTVPERNKVLMFAVTMISVFGMSYCCSSGLNTCFELAYVYESQEVYENRTRNIHRNFKIDSEDFEEIKNHYKQLLMDFKDLDIVKLLYAILPDDDEFEADFMQKILLLGNYCSFGVQTAIMRHYKNRLLYLENRDEHFLSEENNEALTLEVIQELLFLSDKISKTTSKGRLQDIFMSAYYGNRLPMLSEYKDNHDLSEYSHGGDFEYAPDEEEVEKVEEILSDNKVKIHKKRHHMLNRIERLFLHNSSNATPPPVCSADEGEEATVTTSCTEHVEINNSDECSDSDESYNSKFRESVKKADRHKGWLHNLLKKFKHHFEKEHCVEDDEACEYLQYQLDVDIHMETRIDIKVEISQHSEWLTDLKHTNPKFGEAYLSYAVRALRRGKIPLPKHLLHKYHGPKFALHDKFHVWPENNSVFIMYYLYNCPVGDIRHHLSFGNELKYDKFYQGYDDLDCVHCQYHY